MRKIALFIFILTSVWANAQNRIVDDSTKQIYGLSSVRYFVKAKVIENDTNYTHPDSSLFKFSRFGKNAARNWQYQDLGNDGTTSKPIIYQNLKDIGLQSGYTSYNLYKTIADSVRYYKTYSPYSLIEYNQTNRGFAHFRFLQSQNINPKFNITLDIDHIAASQQIGAGAYRENRMIDGWKVILSTNYASKNKKYNLLTHLNHFNFKQIEQGGVNWEGYTTSYDKIRYDSLKYYPALLNKPVSREFNTTYFVYQQLKLAKGFDAYNQSDFTNHKYYFKDANFATDYASGVYVGASSVSDTVTILNRYNVAQNKFGLKGYYKGFLSDVYLRLRYTSIRQDSINRDSINYSNSVFEALLGGNTLLKFKKGGEILLTAEFNPAQKSYLLNGKMNWLGFNAEFTSMIKPVNYFFQQFNSDYYVWKNEFSNPKVQELNLSYQFKNSFLSIEPFWHYQLQTDYIYFDEEFKLKQLSKSSISISNLGFDLKLKYKNFNLSNLSQWASTTNADIIRIPTFSTNVELDYNFTYAQKLPIHIGAIMVYKTKYLADAYNPVMQQFYLQNNYEVWGKPVFDFYSVFMINKVKLGINYKIAGQFRHIINYVSPLYPVLQSHLALKVSWPLFD